MVIDERISGVELLALYGEDDERMGAFLPGLRKIGKVTKGFTSGVAQAIGVPKVVLNVAAKLDPTAKKKPSIKAAVSTAKAAIPPKKTIVPVKKEALKIDTKKALIIGGSAVGALIVLKLLLSAPRRSGV
jgi:hypothetical protein